MHIRYDERTEADRERAKQRATVKLDEDGVGLYEPNHDEGLPGVPIDVAAEELKGQVTAFQASARNIHKQLDFHLSRAVRALPLVTSTAVEWDLVRNRTAISITRDEDKVWKLSYPLAVRVVPQADGSIDPLDFERFAALINRLVRDGLINYARLSTALAIPIFEQPARLNTAVVIGRSNVIRYSDGYQDPIFSARADRGRHIAWDLMWLGFTDFNIAELNARLGQPLFIREGDGGFDVDWQLLGPLLHA